MESSLSSLIYIADDQVANLALLEAILGRSGYTSVVSFPNGSGLLAGIAEHEPDLVLLDLQMPVMDGYAVLEALHSEANRTGRRSRIDRSQAPSRRRPEGGRSALAGDPRCRAPRTLGRGRSSLPRPSGRLGDGRGECRPPIIQWPPGPAVVTSDAVDVVSDSPEFHELPTPARANASAARPPSASGVWMAYRRVTWVDA